MIGLDKRTFLKTAAIGALATSVGIGWPASALFARAKAEGARMALPMPLPPNEARLPKIKVDPWLKIDADMVASQDLDGAGSISSRVCEIATAFSL